MPDRLIRDDLLESDRWLDLSTDTRRLALTCHTLLSEERGHV